MKDLNFRRNESLKQLLECVEKLRGPQGCPWDKEQTHQSLVPFVLDEAYELAEVIQTSPLDDQKFKDELADLLFQVLIHAQIAQEEQRFDFGQILDTLREKLIRRHPHVFNYQGPITKEEVVRNWEKIKASEASTQDSTKPKNPSVNSTERFFKSPRYFSSLERASNIGSKAEELGFDWSSINEVQAKLSEELDELQCAFENQSLREIEEELGDVLFTLAQISRKINLDPERALKKANSKFLTRFTEMIKSLAQKTHDPLQLFKNLSPKQKEELWKTAKKNLQDKQNPLSSS